jgi:hypothetical protein
MASGGRYFMISINAILKTRRGAVCPIVSGWIQRTIPVTNELNGVAYGNNVYVVVGMDGYILTSTDSITWTSQRVSSGAGAYPGLLDVTFGGGYFVAIGSHIYTSTDGYVWTLRHSSYDFGASPLYKIEYGNGYFAIAAQNNSGSGNPGLVIYATDPTGTWTTIPTPADLAVLCIAYGNGIWTIGTYNNDVYTSTNLTTWTLRTTPTTSGQYRCCAYGNNAYIVMGDNAAIIRSINSVNWNLISSGGVNSYRDVDYTDVCFVGVAGSGLVNTSTDGITWSDYTLIPSALQGVGYGNRIWIIAGYISGPTGILFTAQV